MKILVTGATGTVGSALVAELLRRDVAVRAFSRKPPAPGRLPQSVEHVSGDLLEPDSFSRALDGIDALFLLNAVSPSELTQALIALTCARRAGIKRLVYLSVYAVDRFPGVPHFASKAAVERALADSSLDFTILRPGYFFQNDARLKPLLTGPGVYPIPIGSAGMAAVDVRDIAEAAALCLTAPGHAGKTYSLAAPDGLTGPGAAALWSEVLARPVQYPGENFDEFERQLRAQSTPAWLAFDLRVMFQSYVERGFAPTPDAVKEFELLLAHPPRPYSAFAAESARAWRG